MIVKRIFLCLLVLLTVSCAAVSAETVIEIGWDDPPSRRASEGPTEGEKEAQRIFEQGRNLLRLGKYHEARNVYGEFEDSMREELLTLIRAAHDKKRDAYALRLYEIYFYFFLLCRRT